MICRFFRFLYLMVNQAYNHLNHHCMVGSLSCTEGNIITPTNLISPKSHIKGACHVIRADPHHF